MWEKEMQLKPGPKPKQQGKDNSVYNVNQTASKGNSRAYTLSRLKRESPELFADVCAGKLSANAAAMPPGWSDLGRIRKLRRLGRLALTVPQFTEC